MFEMAQSWVTDFNFSLQWSWSKSASLKYRIDSIHLGRDSNLSVYSFFCHSLESYFKCEIEKWIWLDLCYCWMNSTWSFLSLIWQQANSIWATLSKSNFLSVHYENRWLQSIILHRMNAIELEQSSLQIIKRILSLLEPLSEAINYNFKLCLIALKS